MAVLRLRAPLKDMAGGQREQPIEGDDVAAALRDLERRHPQVAGWILDERGLIRRHINVFVNGERAREDTPVATDDEIDVLPAISGG